MVSIVKAVEKHGAMYYTVLTSEASFIPAEVTVFAMTFAVAINQDSKACRKYYLGMAISLDATGTDDADSGPI